MQQVGGHAVRGLDCGVAILMHPPHARDVCCPLCIFLLFIRLTSFQPCSYCFFHLPREHIERHVGSEARRVNCGRKVWRVPHNFQLLRNPTIPDYLIEQPGRTNPFGCCRTRAILYVMGLGFIIREGKARRPPDETCQAVKPIEASLIRTFGSMCSELQVQLRCHVHTSFFYCPCY